MAEHQDRGLFHKHHKKDEPVVVESTQIHSSTTYGADGKPVQTKVEVKKHEHKEHLAEAGVMLGGAFAMYEKRQAKKDPEHAHQHKMGEAIASAVVAGAGVYAKQEHDDKKKAEDEGKHHFFGHHSHK